MKKVLSVFIVILAFPLHTWAAAPQGKGRGKGSSVERSQQKEETGNAQGDQGRRLGQDQERIIRDWFARDSNLAGLPPGLAKREELPPGLQRQIQRNGTLPPGLQRRLQPLPQTLEQSLPELPAGLKRGVVGDDLVLIVEASQQVLDIVHDIF